MLNVPLLLVEQGDGLKCLTGRLSWSGGFNPSFLRITLPVAGGIRSSLFRPIGLHRPALLHQF
jgi:hypothetical protein